MAKLLIPLHPKGREVVLGNGHWGPQGPGVTRQTIEDATSKFDLRYYVTLIYFFYR